jgi:hypothetical protein
MTDVVLVCRRVRRDCAVTVSTWMAGSRQQTAARARTFTGTKLTATQKKTWQGEVLRSKTGALSPADPWSSSASDGGQAQFTTHPLLAWLL